MYSLTTMAAFWDDIVSILNSDFLVAIVTLVVGSLAIYLYKKQQSDHKKDAANIILQEIKNAEFQLSQAKETFLRDKVIPEAVFAMKTSSWGKYGHLFIRDLSDEEWRLVNNFYEKCRQYDEVVEYNNTFFKKNEEQIRLNLHKALAEYTKQLLKNIGETFDISDQKEKQAKIEFHTNDYKELLSGFYDKYMDGAVDNRFFYTPQKTTNDASVIMSTIRVDLSTSSVGIKLEEFVNPKGFFDKIRRKK